MRKVVLDTDIMSEILKGHHDEVRRNSLRYISRFSQLTVTTPTVFEILYGLERVGASAQLQRAEALFAANEEILPQREDYRLAASICGNLARLGTPIGIVDPLIAACAIRRGFGLATGNTRHFDFIREAGYQFRIENWRLPTTEQEAAD